MLELMAPRAIPPIDYRGVPAGLRPKIVKDKTGRVVNVIPRVSAVCRTIKECEDLVYWYGDATFCPFAPVLLLLRAGAPADEGGRARREHRRRPTMRASLARRIAHHRAHPITDPPRQPLYIRPNNFKNFQVPEKSWQEASA